MATRSHEGRLSEGDRLLEAAALQNTSKIAKRLSAFAKAHKQYRGAVTKVTSAEDPLSKQQTRLAAANADLDDLVDQLAARLPGDGLPRANPFKPFDVTAPSKLKNLGHDKQAKECLKLVAAVVKRKGISKDSVTLARAVERAAKELKAATVGMPKHTKPIEDARKHRDAAAYVWELAYASLGRGAKAAEDDGATGLHAALFSGGKKPTRSRARGAGGGGRGGGGGGGGGAGPGGGGGGEPTA